MNFWSSYEELSPLARKGLAAAAFTTVLLVWSLLSYTGTVGSGKLPAPWDVVAAFGQLIGNGQLFAAMYASIERVLIASLIVIGVGVPAGALMGASRKLNGFLSPLIDPFRSAPVVALLPIIVMWFGIGEAMKVAFLVVGSIVFIIPMTRDAVQAVPYSYWESVRDLGASPWESFMRGVLPLALPRIFDAIIVSTSVIWTYITVAEYVNADAGLGQLIQNARRFSAMDQAFVGIFVIIALALITVQSGGWLKRKLFPWETQL